MREAAINNIYLAQNLNRPHHFSLVPIFKSAGSKCLLISVKSQQTIIVSRRRSSLGLHLVHKDLIKSNKTGDTGPHKRVMTGQGKNLMENMSSSSVFLMDKKDTVPPALMTLPLPLLNDHDHVAVSCPRTRTFSCATKCVGIKNGTLNCSTISSVFRSF